ncbi:UbiA family prenyltransferase [Longimicrobium sp.]|uniref:UbiA family prenyltransferase n=1 Tax=Longimicrobium sp. TaxID=2029185 RepID=UPI0039C95D6B
MKILTLLRGLWVSGRPIHSVIAGCATGATIAFLPAAIWWPALAAGCAMTFVTMAGFIINDIYDKSKDALACIQRPVTIGLVTRPQGIIASGLLILISLGLTPLHGKSMVILSITAASVILYSFFARHFPLFKGLYTALLCCAPLSYGAAVGGGQFPNTVFAALVLYISGREVYLDIRDIEGDSRFGLKTIPVLIGVAAARRMAVILIVVGGLSMLVVVRSTLGYLLACSSLLLLGLVLTWPGLELRRRLQLTRMPMFLGALALASTVWTVQ